MVTEDDLSIEDVNDWGSVTVVKQIGSRPTVMHNLQSTTHHNQSHKWQQNSSVSQASNDWMSLTSHKSSSSEIAPLATCEIQREIQALSADAFCHYTQLSSIATRHCSLSCQFIPMYIILYQRLPHLHHSKNPHQTQQRTSLLHSRSHAWNSIPLHVHQLTKTVDFQQQWKFHGKNWLLIPKHFSDSHNMLLYHTVFHLRSVFTMIISKLNSTHIFTLQDCASLCHLISSS